MLAPFLFAIVLDYAMRQLKEKRKNWDSHYQKEGVEGGAS